MWFAMNFIIVHGMFDCSSFLIGSTPLLQYYLMRVVSSPYSVILCTCVASVCLVCFLLCKEEGSSPVSLKLLRGGYGTV